MTRGLPAAGCVLALVTLFGACSFPDPTPAPVPASTAAPTAGQTLEALPSVRPSPTPSPSSAPTPAATLQPISSWPPEFSLHVPILTYHVIAPRSVASSYSLAGLDVDPAVFDAQLRLLKAHGWRTITADRLAGDLAAQQRPPAKTFVITIDDGHDDGFTYALPILRKYGFVATFYVVVGRIGDPYNLTWAEIGALRAAGMEIGNHTMTHVDLSGLSPARLAYEIDLAQLTLASHLGAAPTTIAYPFWAYNDAVIRVVRAAGLLMAFTKGPVPYEGASDRYSVPRLEVEASVTPLELLARIEPYG